MKILVTGSNGFLGKHITSYFRDTEHAVTTLSRGNADLNFDLTRTIHFFETSFDLVIHAAGKAHLTPSTKAEELEFFDVNVRGLENLLNSLSKFPPKRFLFISSVSVYGLTNGKLIGEDSPLLAIDPYGKSKSIAEKLVQDWSAKNKTLCTIFRLPLLIGDNPLGNYLSMINSLKKGYYFNIDGGGVCKSMVLANDVVRYILPASEIGGIYNLTDGIHPNFLQLSRVIGRRIGRKSIPNLSLFIAKVIAKMGDFLGPNFPLNSNKLLKITSELTFDDSKAREKFGWNPIPVLLNIVFN